MSIFSRLFARAPRYQVSAYSTLYAGIVARLKRNGVRVGGTADVPRIEAHSITEGERLDKDGALRQLTLTVECISNSSVAEAAAMNDENLKRLTETDLDLGNDWSCIGIVPTILQDLTEASDTQKVLYRILQQFNIYIQRNKS